MVGLEALAGFKGSIYFGILFKTGALLNPSTKEILEEKRCHKALSKTYKKSHRNGTSSIRVGFCGKRDIPL